MSKNKTRRFEADRLFFTSDLHLSHRYVAKIRGYSDKGLMNRIVIRNWNEIIDDKDDIFILGDVSFDCKANTITMLENLKGKKHLILGNHDKKLSKEVLGIFETVNQQLEIDAVTEYGIQRLFLNHYSMQVWNRHHYGAFHLFGHSHGNLQGIGKSMDVGLDTNNLRVYSYYNIERKLNQKEIQIVDHHEGRG